MPPGPAAAHLQDKWGKVIIISPRGDQGALPHQSQTQRFHPLSIDLVHQGPIQSSAGQGNGSGLAVSKGSWAQRPGELLTLGHRISPQAQVPYWSLHSGV